MENGIIYDAEKAGKIAADAIFEAFSIARALEIDEATMASYYLNALIAVYRIHGGPGADNAVTEMTTALAKAEAIRILDIDNRVFGDIMGCA